MKKAAVLDDIAKATNGKSYKTSKYCFDGVAMPQMDYDDHKKQLTWRQSGETEIHDAPINLKPYADRISKNSPLFSYFLDGSRRVYKVDDMTYTGRAYPIIAGQVGVGCCERSEGHMIPLRMGEKSLFWRDLVIALPNVAKSSNWDDEFAFEYLRKKINDKPELLERHIEFSYIMPYSTKVDAGEKIENKGIAAIQDYMVDREQKMVAEIVKKGFLLPTRYLLKDGSLEYQVHKFDGKQAELRRFKNNYQYVVGASKSFNPEFCVDKRGRNNSDMVANLKLFSRTPVSKYSSERIGDMEFAVWFVRIRDQRVTNNPFDGILKLEKILVTPEQSENGLDSEEVDLITANVINERNPVCYGADRRWANHLYPVYVTESYLKSKYLSENMFLELF